MGPRLVSLSGPKNRGPEESSGPRYVLMPSTSTCWSGLPARASLRDRSKPQGAVARTRFVGPRLVTLSGAKNRGPEESGGPRYVAPGKPAIPWCRKTLAKLTLPPSVHLHGPIASGSGDSMISTSGAGSHGWYPKMRMKCRVRESNVILSTLSFRACWPAKLNENQSEYNGSGSERRGRSRSGAVEAVTLSDPQRAC